MGIDKTRRDIKYEDEAQAINEALHAAGVYGMHVIGGGGKGPYTLVVERLSRKRLDKVMAAVKAALERKA